MVHSVFESGSMFRNTPIVFRVGFTKPWYVIAPNTSDTDAMMLNNDGMVFEEVL